MREMDKVRGFEKAETCPLHSHVVFAVFNLELYHKFYSGFFWFAFDVL